MVNVCIFYDRFLYFIAIWYGQGHLVILWPFGIFSPVLVYCIKKSGNLAFADLCLFT
jgi:hypothetical protein